MRLKKIFLGDIRFQAAYGFYFLYAVFTAFYCGLLLIFPQEWRQTASVIMIYSDPAALGLFCMGAIILLEKDQRVLCALVVSPVKTVEYIVSKVLSLSLVSIGAACPLAILAGAKQLPLLLVVTGLTSIIFSLLAMIVGTKINSLNHYMLAVLPIEILCFVPALIYLFSPVPWMRWYPLCGAISLLQGNSSLPVYDVISLLVCMVVLFAIAHKTTATMWRTLEGATQ